MSLNREIAHRYARSADAPSIVRIAQASLGGHPAYSRPAKAVLLRQFEIARVEHRITHDPGYYLVAERDGVVLAFTTLSIHGGVARSDWTMADPDCRLPRIGAQLFVHAMEQARLRGAHMLWGESLVDNPVVARFALRRGGRIVARVENYWFRQDYDLWAIPLHRDRTRLEPKDGS